MWHRIQCQIFPAQERVRKEKDRNDGQSYIDDVLRGPHFRVIFDNGALSKEGYLDRIYARLCSEYSFNRLQGCECG